MSSPFLMNRQRKLAAMAGGIALAAALSAPDPKTASGLEYAALKVRLDDNLRQLADVASHEARIPLKAEFIAQFAPWFEGIIAAGAPVQDEILLTCMVWAMDVGDYALAVRLGEFAVRNGLTMPERYKRSVACFLREDIAEIALQKPDAIDLHLLVTVEDLTAGADMPDQAKAKIHKALGRAWAAKAEAFDATDESAPAGGKAAFTDEALQQMRRALALDSKAGVKKDIETLERRLRDLQAAAGAGAGSA